MSTDIFKKQAFIEMFVGKVGVTSIMSRGNNIGLLFTITSIRKCSVKTGIKFYLIRLVLLIIFFEMSRY